MAEINEAMQKAFEAQEGDTTMVDSTFQEDLKNLTEIAELVGDVANSPKVPNRYEDDFFRSALMLLGGAYLASREVYQNEPGATPPTAGGSTYS